MLYETKDVKFGRTHTCRRSQRCCEFQVSSSALTAAPQGAEKPAHFADGNLTLISITSTRQYIGDTSSGLCFLPLSFHFNFWGLRTTWFDLNLFDLISVIILIWGLMLVNSSVLNTVTQSSMRRSPKRIRFVSHLSQSSSSVAALNFLIECRLTRQQFKICQQGRTFLPSLSYWCDT